MTGPRCPGVLRDSSGPQGEEVSLGSGLQAYYAPPKASGRQMGVVVVHDVFGFHTPGCRLAVDRLAGKGYAALMPDLFGGKGLSRPAWPSAGEPPEGPAFAQWLGEITSEPFWGALRADVRTAMDFLRGKGCKRFGVVGFCWGGRAAEVVASGPGAEALAAAASVNGVRHDASTYGEVRCDTMLYIAVSGDPLFSDACQEEISAAGGRVRVFEGVPHGFAVSGDLADAVRESADEAMAEVEALLHEACLSRPRYTKVGSLRPGSRGASLLLKVLGGPAQAADQDAHGSGAPCLEALCGDDSGQAIARLTAAQAAGLAKDEVICMRNVSIQMVKNRMRLVADELCRAGAADAALRAAGEIGEQNISEIRYELTSA